MESDEITHATNEGLDLVRKKVDEHHGKPKGGLTKERVHQISLELIRAKIQPTVEKVRYVNEGGSPNVIHPALRSFFADTLPKHLRESAGPQVPTQMLELWQSIEANAEASGAAALAEAQQALEQRGFALDGREVGLNEREAKQNQRELDQQALIATQELRVTESNAMRDAALAKQAATQDELNALVVDLTSVKAAKASADVVVETLRADFANQEAKLLSQQAETETAIAALTDRNDALQAQLTTVSAAAETAHVHAGAERARLLSVNEQATALLTQANAQLLALHASSRNDRESAAERERTLSEAVIAAKGDLDQQAATAKTASVIYKISEDRLNEVRAERDRLAAQAATDRRLITELEKAVVELERRLTLADPP